MTRPPSNGASVGGRPRSEKRLAYEQVIRGILGKKPFPKRGRDQLHVKLLASRPPGVDTKLWAVAFESVAGESLRVFFGRARKERS